MGKKSKLLTLILCLIFFTTVTTSLVMAQEAKLSIVGEPTYFCYNHEQNPSRYYYQINVTIHNQGDEKSLPTDFQIYENGHAVISPKEYQSLSVEPGYKKFVFNWSTSQESKTIEFVYSPTDPNIQETDDNSERVSIEMIFNKDAEGKTPGFELILIIISIIFVVWIRNKKLIN